jgi:hypothetical protein
VVSAKRYQSTASNVAVVTVQVASAGGSGNPTPPGTTTVINVNPPPLAGNPSGFTAFIKGFEDDTFRGNSPMTREQFIAILCRLKNPDSTPAADKSMPSFRDVAPQRWSYNEIEWAANAGLIEVGDGNFRPTEPLIRAEMAVILVKADGLIEMADNTFSDLEWHPVKADILRAVKAKILSGYPDGTFRPNDNSTRSEAVTALVRYMLGGEPTDEMWQNINLKLNDVLRSDWAYKYIALAVNGYVKL